MDAGDTMTVVGASQTETRLRLYQQEMLDASLEKNIIVAMDTGSGKTHVAVARMLAELEKSELAKIVWFLCPSVALSHQQHNFVREHLPSAYQVISLTGSDGVDKWTDQRLWDAVLTNVRVVVGTPAVLTDALTHGFVRIHRLALLVIDEAHRCIKSSPMNNIMKLFYYPSKSRGEAVPRILGLSASPVMNDKEGSLEQIERNLDAVAMTPKEERNELAKYIHPPEIIEVIFGGSPAFTYPSSSKLCNMLHDAAEDYDFTSDPYVVELRQRDDEWTQRQMERFYRKKRTYSSDQVRALSRRAQTLFEQLGQYAAEWYVTSYVDRLRSSVSVDTTILPEVSTKEQQHVLGIFTSICSKVAAGESHEAADALSDKAVHLMDLLCRQASPHFRGIVFVEQRAVVSTLMQLLRNSQSIAANFNIGGFVGTSSYANRKSNVADLTEAKVYQQDLEAFRKGQKNLIIATKVLEEGIDVPACNQVICFDIPKNLTSFVQGRGRARQKNSKYFLFIPEDDMRADTAKWQRQEEHMKLAYMDDTRSHEVASDLTEDDEALGKRVYKIESTGALLTLDNSKAHLYHFCDVSTLHGGSSVDVRPEFSPRQGEGDNLWTCTVTLPAFVHPEVRAATSAESWKTEEVAIKDAAFEAYVALHKADLVNDNLLPLAHDYGPEAGHDHIDQPSIITVSEQRSIWPSLAQRHVTKQKLHPCVISLTCDSTEEFSVNLWLPTELRGKQTFPLHWNEHTVYECHIIPRSLDSLDDHDVDPQTEDGTHRLQRYTCAVLKSVHGNRMPDEQLDLVPLLSPPLDISEGNLPAKQCFEEGRDLSNCGLVRVNGQPGRSYIFRRFAKQEPAQSLYAGPSVIVSPFPKRRDFPHPVEGHDGVNAAYTTEQAFPISDWSKWRPPFISEVLNDNENGTRDLSSKSLADVVEALIGAAMVDGGLKKAYKCIQTLLPDEIWFDEDVTFNTLTSTSTHPGNHTSLATLEHLIGHQFQHKALLVEAVTHASLPFQRNGGMSYERLEFLGDAVLDLIIVPKLFAHPRNLRHWELHSVHEGLVNGLFLGFCCMTYSVDQDQFSITNTVAQKQQEAGPEIYSSARKVHLHDFLRAGGEVMRAKRQALQVYQELQSTIGLAITSPQKEGGENNSDVDKEYPWTHLLALKPPKFLSDIIESVLGALYLDTGGDTAKCEVFLTRISIMNCMGTILDEGSTMMEVRTPKERLGIAAGNSVVKYVNSTVQLDGEGSEGSRRIFHCAVEVDGKTIAAENGEASRAEAEARAALAAVKSLRKEPVDQDTMEVDGVNSRKRELEGLETAW
ncbi:P-loop containing nucleoside triphosphate hydrolase protein [Hortaea werneckii]|nr:P-loop containing nucleoside triphosphate hydrolase protein [Hortaea werneckii]KAI7627818.1 P-loop containing nucleoside triphosphate hydrolase protein [Hortaea werneckii]KAI7637365.1 P-loop containing nucleoside triphosphate hydrolase protein [Hortaea werneckii]KAI7683070.1 P-loop containing nucleoside triphosphate hydrolase protein [Hortaea werneckii]KAI7713588.1 P-loop containing nucleoside triphosphate hydrolase protein [Hortaea werneckii]